MLYKKLSPWYLSHFPLKKHDLHRLLSNTDNSLQQQRSKLTLWHFARWSLRQSLFSPPLRRFLCKSCSLGKDAPSNGSACHSYGSAGTLCTFMCQEEETHFPSWKGETSIAGDLRTVPGCSRTLASWQGVSATPTIGLSVCLSGVQRRDCAGTSCLFACL